MSVENCQRDVQRHQNEIAKLQQEKGRVAGRAADEAKRVHSASEAAGRTRSPSAAHSKLRDAQRHQEQSVRHQQKVADIEGKIAREQGRLNDAQRRLASAQNQEHRQRMREQQRAAQEHERRMSAITGKLTHHEQLHEVTMSAIERLQQLPERITVLFLAADPVNQPALRLCEEARAIGEMIRKSDLRDSVRLESRWAVQPLDVLQAINECQPRMALPTP